jgi:hypothetical protein
MLAFSVRAQVGAVSALNDILKRKINRSMSPFIKF